MSFLAAGRGCKRICCPEYACRANHFRWVMNAPCRFHALPSWVHVLVTARPEVEAGFKHWDPTRVWIRPDDARNQEDIRSVLESRLKQYVAEEDVKAAANIMLQRSEVSCVWQHAVQHSMFMPCYT